MYCYAMSKLSITKDFINFLNFHVTQYYLRFWCSSQFFAPAIDLLLFSPNLLPRNIKRYVEWIWNKTIGTFVKDSFLKSVSWMKNLQLLFSLRTELCAGVWINGRESDKNDQKMANFQYRHNILVKSGEKLLSQEEEIKSQDRSLCQILVIPGRKIVKSPRIDCPPPPLLLGDLRYFDRCTQHCFKKNLAPTKLFDKLYFPWRVDHLTIEGRGGGWKNWFVQKIIFSLASVFLLL